MKTAGKAFGWITIAVALLLFLPPASEGSPLGAIRVNLLEGDVQVKIADTGEWVPASVNMPLVEGDELWVPDGSRAAIQSTLGDYVRLDEGTALQILRMDLDSYQFHLAEGRVYVLNRAPRRSVLQFDTPDASIRAFGNASFGIDIPGGETDISVFRGSVQAENDGGTTTVRAGNMLAVGEDGTAELSPVPSPDDWRRWNAQRDRIVLAREKLRVPAGGAPGVLQRLRWRRPVGECSGIRVLLDPHGCRDRRLGAVPAREVGVEGRRLRLGRR